MNPTRVLGACLLATMVVGTTACGDDDEDVTGTDNTATVRFVNTTGTPIDIGLNNNYTGNSNIAFGGSSQCLSVTPGTTGLTFRQNGTNSTFTPTGFNASSIQAGGNYTVVIGGAAGAGGTYTGNAFANTLSGATATAGGVRVINATSNTDQYNLYVGPSGALPTTASMSGFGAGMASTSFYPVAGTQGQVRLTTGTGASQTTVFESSAFPVTANQYQSVVIADPSTGSSTLRSFSVNACQ